MGLVEARSKPRSMHGLRRSCNFVITSPLQGKVKIYMSREGREIFMKLSIERKNVFLNMRLNTVTITVRQVQDVFGNLQLISWGELCVFLQAVSCNDQDFL